MITKIWNFIKAYRLKKQTKEAIERAVFVAQHSGRKQLVILYKGRPIVVSKQRLKTLIKQRKFNKGVRIADIERNAIFITK